MASTANIIEKIISMEWEMFSAVNEGQERANCQEDQQTFEAMRTAQFSAWARPVQEAYLCDLEEACRTGRNLVEEKYIHMMKTTEPEQYAALLHRVSPPSKAALTLVQEVSDILFKQMQALFEKYPYISGRGRPLHAKSDGGAVSVETYQICELMTYSEQTLTALKKQIAELEKEGILLARKILENTVRFYGYTTLEEAEAAVERIYL